VRRTHEVVIYAIKLGKRLQGCTRREMCCDCRPSSRWAAKTALEGYRVMVLTISSVTSSPAEGNVMLLHRERLWNLTTRLAVVLGTAAVAVPRVDCAEF